ncbi:MAG: hypothetical protein JJD92_07375 [Frankiaceae bacterium]|nr:hypothetical protein [Frankiaceae bacterium]
MSDRSERIALAVRAARAADALVLGDQDTLGTRDGRSVPKIETGIPGFDAITMGGLPQRRAAVLAGQAGSGKTVFAAHFLATRCWPSRSTSRSPVRSCDGSSRPSGGWGSPSC